MTLTIRKNIAQLEAYKPPLEGRGEAGLMLLDFNERTIPASPAVEAALLNYITSGTYTQYPRYEELTPLIAAYAEVKANNILITNGSDRAIELLIQIFLNSKDEIIIPTPSFALFDQYAQIKGAKIIAPTYKPDLRFPLKEVLEAMNTKTRLVVICNPNNPTGTGVTVEEIEMICKKAQSIDALILVDEAYYEFSQVTCSALLEKYKQLVITRTLSKAFGLAGLRIGYLIANKETIQILKKVQSPYEVNMAAVVAAQAALEDPTYMRDYCDEVMKKSKPLIEAFFEAQGIFYFPSEANYILFKPKSPTFIFKALRKKNILIRPRTGPQIQDTLRVSIGTVSNMNQFIYEYSQINN